MLNHKAFSILELLVVITIIAIMSIFGYPKVDQWLTDREISNEVNKFIAYFEEKKSEVKTRIVHLWTFSISVIEELKLSMLICLF